jgi:large subunit ribosomal protein L5
MTRLLERYRQEIVPKMMEKFAYTNKMRVPKFHKIVVSMGVGSAVQDGKRLESAMRDLALVTGQKPKFTKGKKSVAGFRLRKGQSIGCMVTLRGKRMYEFLDRLVNITIPRVRDFRGLSPDSFDKDGNYSLGLPDQFVFPEISVDKVEFPQGVNIALVIDNSSREESRELLSLFGIPFRRLEK